ncbi:MAG: metal ABC transporter ATP-binding protein [Candidatus Delongbacteria bacterium]|nr:metal ABC transporter ATP-binding protein [Candidatus Delongbacteria bacterium]
MEKILEIRNITAGYDKEVIIKDINLDIYENDFLAIIGPNGGGKSTLLKVILGLLKPYSGEIIFKKKINIGYLPQLHSNDRQFPISVKETILSGLMSRRKVLKKFSREDHDAADELIHKFHLENYTDLPVGDLSGGQVQRVFLCRAMISRPELLILDEPNSFVDQGFSVDLYKILLEMNKDITIIMVSHDTGVITSYIKNIACINRTLHYHSGSEISEDLLDQYQCPVELITHGKLPHRVLKDHIHNGDK